MNLRKLTDDELHDSTVATARRQREITLELLNRLNEVERRHLFSKFNCSSLHGYCVQELKMTSGNACHHMDAARLLREVPAIHEKVLNGSIAVTTVADAEAFFKREARNGNRFDTEAKAELLVQLEEKTTRDADKIMLSHSANPDIHLKETVKQRTATIVELKLHLDEEAMKDLERLREVWSHAMPYAKLSDIIKRAAKEALEKNDPFKTIERAEALAAKKVAARKAKAKIKECRTKIESQSTEAKVIREVEVSNAGLSDVGFKTPAPGLSIAAIRNAVWKRDQARCKFVDPRTGERCDARHFVEEDHILPKAMGGEYSVENLRLRCRSHNQRHAIDCYGVEKMREHLQSTRH